MKASTNILAGIALALTLAASPALAQQRIVVAGPQAETDAAGPAAMVVEPEMIAEALVNFLENNRHLLPPAEIRVSNLSYPAPFELPGGRLDIEVIPAEPNIIGSRRFTFIFRVNGRVERNLALRCELEVLAPVAVAALDLARGAILTENDITLATLDITRLRNPVLDARELVGKMLLRAVRAGDTLDRSQVDEPAVINRGEVVTIVALSGTMQLTATGVARDNGRLGEAIRIRNSDSQKEILCQVVAPGIVQVEF